MDAANALPGAAATSAEPERPRPRDPGLRAPVVEVRRRQGDRGPREVRHVARPATTRCSTPSSTGPRRSRPTRCWSAGCAGCAPPASGSAPRAASASRSERGACAATSAGSPSPRPLVLLSVLAVAMAGLAFVATRRPAAPTERRPITVASRPRRPPSSRPVAAADQAEPSPRAAPSSAARSTSRSTTTPASPAWPAGSPRRPSGRRLAGRRAPTTGTAPSPPSTVYYPPRLEAAAELLALDLGISRRQPAVDPMRLDRLTVILTDDAAADRAWLLPDSPPERGIGHIVAVAIPTQ